jgi:hypothetical protein
MPKEPSEDEDEGEVDDGASALLNNLNTMDGAKGEIEIEGKQNTTAQKPPIKIVYTLKKGSIKKGEGL